MVGVMEIYKLLPKTNCKKCGLATCMAFAAEFILQKKKIKDCPLLAELKYGKGLPELKRLESEFVRAGETGLIIHPEKCFGCNNCVIACPVNVAAEPTRCGVGLGPKTDKSILRVVDGVVVCSNPKECRRFGLNKVLCNACTSTCPSKAIEFV